MYRLGNFPGNSILIIFKFLIRYLLYKINNTSKFETNEFQSNPYTIYIKDQKIPKEIDYIFKGKEKFPEVSIYVHGSWGDETNNSFSDVDSLIIYSEKNIANFFYGLRLSLWLNKVEMRMCRIDPLQHHGNFVIKNENLNRINLAYLPLLVLKKSLLVQGSKTVKYTYLKDDSLLGLKNNIFNNIQDLQILFDKYDSNMINIYEMKKFIGSVFITITYLFQYKGNYVSKKWSIENCDKILDRNSIIIVNKCEIIRKNWNKVLDKKSYIQFKKLIFIFNNPYLWRSFSKKFSPKFCKNDFPEINKNEFLSFKSKIKSFF